MVTEDLGISVFDATILNANGIRKDLPCHAAIDPWEYVWLLPARNGVCVCVCADEEISIFDVLRPPMTASTFLHRKPRHVPVALQMIYIIHSL